MRARSGFLLLAFAAALISGCSDRPANRSETVSSTRLRVAVVNYPLQYFAETIGGGLVEVLFPVPKGEDPAYWKPTPEEAALYQKADCILLNGAGYAKWIEHVSLPNSQMVDTSRSFLDQLIPVERGATHIHGPQGKHTHEGFAFTTWLDLQLAIAQARAVRDALLARLPKAQAVLGERFVALKEKLLSIDADLREIFKKNHGRKFIFFHPVYQYFARAYGVDGRSVHWEPGEVPTEAMWSEFEKLRNEYPADIMIWEKEPLPETGKRLSDMGVTCVVVDPCGAAPESGDLLSVLRDNAEAFRKTLVSREWGRPVRCYVFTW